MKNIVLLSQFIGFAMSSHTQKEIEGIIDSYKLSSEDEKFEDEERATVKMETLPSNAIRAQYQIDISKYDDISNYSKNCTLKFDTQAALFCESTDG